MPTIATSTDTFTVQPFATVPVNGNAADLIDAVLSALESEPRALDPVVFYDYDRQRIDATFQVQDDHGVGLDHELAAAGAAAIFDAALIAVGVEARTAGIALVEGDDADQLP
jgi:hypothetical protein